MCDQISRYHSPASLIHKINHYSGYEKWVSWGTQDHAWPLANSLQPPVCCHSCCDLRVSHCDCQCHYSQRSEHSTVAPPPSQPLSLTTPSKYLGRDGPGKGLFYWDKLFLYFFPKCFPVCYLTRSSTQTYEVAGQNESCYPSFRAAVQKGAALPLPLPNPCPAPSSGCCSRRATCPVREGPF